MESSTVSISIDSCSGSVKKIVLVTLAVTGAIVALLVLAVHHAREAARQSQCK